MAGPFAIVDTEHMTERLRARIAESQASPVALFHIGARVVDSLGEIGTVTDEQIVHTSPCREHAAYHIGCLWCPGAIQRITVTHDDGGWTEQAANRCAFAPPTLAEIEADLLAQATHQALHDADNLCRYGH